MAREGGVFRDRWVTAKVPPDEHAVQAADANTMNMDVLATREFPVWRTLRFVLGILAVLLVVLAAALIVSHVIAGVSGRPHFQDNAGGSGENIPEALSYLSGAALTLLALRRLSGTTLDELGLHSLHKRDGAAIAIAIVCSLVFGAGYSIALGAFGILHHTQAGFETFHPRDWIDRLATIAATVVVAPVFEELFFRGLLYNAFRKWFGGLLAVLGSSALFGLVHGDAILFGELSAKGIILCLVYQRTRNLYAPMIVHGATNLVAVLALMAQ